MTTLHIDKQKVNHIVFDTLNRLSDSGAHPAEIIFALSECVGRVIGSMPSEMAQRELLDLSIKQMTGAILAIHEHNAEPSKIILPN